MISSRLLRVLVTRSHEGNSALGEKLLRIGCQPIQIDTISLAQPDDWSSVDETLGRLSWFDWLVFTSPNGVKFFLQRMKTLKLPLPERKPLLAAVGSATAVELSRAGLWVAFVPSTYLTKALGEELPQERGSKVLLLRTDIVDPRLADTLTRRGFEVEERAIYRTVVKHRRNFDDDHQKIPELDLIVFASPSAVRGLCQVVPESELRKLRTKTAFCIGPVTAEAARASGFVEVVVPRIHTVDAVVDEISRRRESGVGR